MVDLVDQSIWSDFYIIILNAIVFEKKKNFGK